MADMTIHLYPLTDMADSPFTNNDDLRVLAKHGIQMTDDYEAADLLLVNRYPLSQHGPLVTHAKALIHKLRGRFGKPILVWTHEPRQSQMLQETVEAKGIYPPVHVMNIHVGDLSQGNIGAYGCAIDKSVEPVTDLNWRRGEGRPIAALATYLILPSRFRTIVNGRNVDIAAHRQRLMANGYRRGVVDVYGYRWPKRMRVEDSRWGNNWHGLKLKILEKYRLNLCMENTIAPGYCSEKIWDAIRAQCLPIYWGQGTSIYDNFPQNSFIDVADFEPLDKVYDFIAAMTDEQYLRRLNTCIEVYNHLHETGAYAKQHDLLLMNIVHRARRIMADECAERHKGQT